MITIEFLTKMFPTTPKETLMKYIEPLKNVCAKYEINTRHRVAAFIAQVGHESGGFTIARENMNYSAERLTVVFKKYFKTLEEAQRYAKQPEKIGNYVYANRMGNGGPETGDGYRHRGHGLIQLTGKENHMNFAKSLNMSLAEVVDFLATPLGAATSAGWFWNKNNLNALADAGDMTALTRRINGGTNGAEERQKLYKRALTLLA